MEKRALIAVVISILILVIWFGFIAPPQQPPRQPPAGPDSVTDPDRRPDATEPPAEGFASDRDSRDAAEPGEEDAAGDIAEEERVAADTEERIEVTNRFFKVELTNRGARAISWRLFEFTTGEDQPLELLPRFQDGESYFLAVGLDDPHLERELNEALYQVQRDTLPTDERRGSGQRITFSYNDGRGLEARKVLDLYENDYLVDVLVEVIDRGRPRPAMLYLGPGFAAQEVGRGQSNYYYDGQAVLNSGGQVNRFRRRKMKDDQMFGGSFLWAGLEDQYFASLIVNEPGAERAGWRNVELTRRLPEGTAQDEAPEPRLEPVFFVSAPEEGKAHLFIGPKDFRLLRETGFQLEKVVWFSSFGWLRPIVKYLFLSLLWIHDNVTHNYGLAIVMATVVLRLLLFPLNQYAMVHMKKQQLQMQKLQPKMKAIKAKHKKKDAQTRAKMNQEMMEMYRKEGVNPAGGLTGCLPLLAQFPILIGFYNMLTVTIELRGAPFFGWIQDLSLKDPFYITPILMAVTMFTQQKMAMSKIKDPQQLQQQRMMLFMPVMFGFICLQMPSGLVLYWFVNNILGIGQQYLVNRHTSRLESPEPKGDKSSKGNKNGKTGKGKKAKV
jgi:YidC/Oxa1 family membrane protein insertase